MGLEATTVITGEPAMSFTYDPKRSLYEQFSKAQGGREGEGELEAAVRRVDEALVGGMSVEGGQDALDAGMSSGDTSTGHSSDQDDAAPSNSASNSNAPLVDDNMSVNRLPPALQGPNTPFFSMFSLFEGSPTYKQRRKKGGKSIGVGAGPMRKGSASRSESEDGYERGRYTSRFHSHERGRYASESNERGRYQSSERMMEMEDYSDMSAVDMFMAQARGELAPASQTERKRHAQAQQKAQPIQVQEAVYYSGFDSPSHPPSSTSASNGLISSSPVPVTMGQQPQQRPRSHEEMHRHTYPTAAPSSAGFLTQSFAAAQSQAHPQGHTLPFRSTMDSIQSSNTVKTKAFVCPLFSCGRLFKRMEHLKRHLRTHTMERPYQCQRCKKRFSRSDNLNQHVRTHARADGEVESGSGECDDGGDSGGSDDIDELDGDDGSLSGYASGMAMNIGVGYRGGNVNGMDSMPDVQMCEVEVQGDVQDVQGDEEGEVTASVAEVSVPAFVTNGTAQGQDVYFPSSGMPGVVATPFPSGEYADASGPQWASRAHPSPAFSSVSIPSPPLGSVPLIRSNRSSLTSSPASYIRQSSSVYNDNSEYVTSISAPSHKQGFDHAGLYPPGVIENANGPGPIRRHRSMTPSLMKNVDGIRRPLTATSGDLTSSGSGPASRAYHPYANAATSNGFISQSRAGSAQSSPASYPMHLEYPPNQQQISTINRSESHPRSTSNGQLQDQMRQMMNLNHEPRHDTDLYTINGSGVTGSTGLSEIYRTDSPVPYATDLPVPYPSDSYPTAVTHEQFDKHGLYPLGMMDAHPHPGQYADQTVDAGYYSTLGHPQHVTL